MKLYSEKKVRALVERLREEYEEVVRAQREALESLKEEDRVLRARVAQLEGERGEVSNALLHAVKEGERIKEEGQHAAENERKELLLLAEKCRLLSARLTEKYPDEEDCSDFAAFTAALREKLGETEESEESAFNMDDVLFPKEPLDLGKLCRGLGLMEEDDE